jgi:hypothetical protein
MTAGPGSKHVHGTAADFVDILDLPAGVMEERHCCLLHEQVVVVGGATQERPELLDDVADPKAQAIDEERLRDGEVGGAERGSRSPTACGITCAASS